MISNTEVRVKYQFGCIDFIEIISVYNILYGEQLMVICPL